MSDPRTRYTTSFRPTCRWDKTSDGTLRDDLVAIRCDQRGIGPDPQRRLRVCSTAQEPRGAVVEGIAIAALLGAAGFETLICFFVEHNNLIL
jgi:hypothetical protein